MKRNANTPDLIRLAQNNLNRIGCSAGEANGSCGALVVNEVLYDFAHPTLGAADEGRTFRRHGAALPRPSPPLRHRPL